MRAFIVLVVLAVAAKASVLSEIGQKLVPRFADPFIINGEDADPRKAPYIVSLGLSPEKHSHVCGGSIIAKRWVLTAAHCILKPVGMSVVAGLHRRLQIDESAQQRVADFIRVHEDYTGGVGPYDIALMHVDQDFVFNQYVQPITLPSREELHEGIGTLYGWGMTNALWPTGAKTLQTVKVNILNYDECVKKMTDDAPLAKSNVCSDSEGLGISACSGDSGGPFVVERENTGPELIGIVSWGYIPCGWANKPSVYTLVSSYIEWVARIQSAYYTLH